MENSVKREASRNGTRSGASPTDMGMELHVSYNDDLDLMKSNI